MPVRQEVFGSLPDGTEITKFILSNLNNISIEIIQYGGIITAVHLPDKEGNRSDVCLGFDNLDDYLAGHPYFGCIVGRVANRIGGASFKLGGIEYKLAKNDNGVNHLHGGKVGFDKVVWEAEPFETEDVCGVTLKYTSEDDEEGYPGLLDVTVVYSLNEEDELTINYKAETDAPTPVNLTNHAYWNFAGAGSGNILGHMLKLNCDRALAVDDQLIPTGAIKNVADTPYDFRKAKAIGQDIAEVGGYDDCFVINRSADDDDLVKAAEVVDPVTGRGMRLYTTKPGVQLYTGNFLNGIKGAGGVFNKHDAFCLETQYFPNAVNQPNFPSIILTPGETYHHITVHQFFID
ncbi:galactose mutarotase [candidate division KSB1 bacterium]|nr:galactose mutarotase [candidate division KSB1 bacterium]RQW09979.1 MAG: galactose mutarotase [candidate division KSB1 bacterium]